MKRAVFLDRDGVINKLCYHHEMGLYSAKNMDEFIVLEGVKEAIKKIKEMNFLAIVVTNQPGFAFGYLKEKDIEKINDYMIKELKIDKIYTCPHHPHHTGECECRKPKSGLLKIAAKENDIDISKSYIVGDNISDIKAGKDCYKKIFIGTKRCDMCTLFEEKNAHPDAIVKNLKLAVDKIFEFEKII